MRDVVKVLDFGISKIRGSKTVLTQDAALLGTPQYMAPEQATGRNDEIDVRTDVFAFGAMTFEMLAGRAPFTGDTLAAVIHAIVYTPTPPLAAAAKDVPPPIVAAIERALDKNRDARFPDVNSFVKAVTSRSLATAPGSAAAPASGTGRRRRSGSRASHRGAPSGSPWASALLAVGRLHGLEAAAAGARRGPAPDQTTAAAEHDHERPAAKPPANTNTPTDTPTPTPTGESRRSRKPTPRRPPSKKRPARSRRSKRSKGKETLSPEAARDLDEAEAALDAGKPADAVRLAQHSLYAQKTSRAYAVIARARCAQGDLGNAKAALAQVSARDRSQVVRACGKLGVELR